MGFLFIVFFLFFGGLMYGGLRLLRTPEDKRWEQYHRR